MHALTVWISQPATRCCTSCMWVAWAGELPESKLPVALRPSEEVPVFELLTPGWASLWACTATSALLLTDTLQTLLQARCGTSCCWM